MKEDIKDVLTLFGIAIFMWILSQVITNPILTWLLKWGFKIGAVLFVLAGIIAITNAVISYRRNKRSKKYNDNNISK